MFKYAIAAAAAVVLSATIIPANSAHATVITWTSGQTANYNTPADWGGSVPGFPTSSDLLIDGTGSNVTYTGTSGDVLINSTVTVSNSATFTQNTGNGAYFHIGNGAGTGTLNVNSSAVVDITNAGAVFDGDGGTGTISVNAGTLFTRYLTVENNSQLLLSNGGIVNASAGLVPSANGGTQISLSGNAAIHLTGGNLTINAGNLGTSSTSNISVNGGTITTDTATTPDGGSHGTLALGGTVTLSNGSIDVKALEFKPSAVGSISMTGGTLNANLIRFENAGGMNFSGGFINLFRGSISSQADGYTLSTADAINDGYLNFTVGSTGVIDVLNSNLANDLAQGYLTNGGVRYNGITDPTNFSITSDGGNGTLIQLIPSLQGSSVPEPASVALLGFGALALITRRRKSH